MFLGCVVARTLKSSPIIPPVRVYGELISVVLVARMHVI